MGSGSIAHEDEGRIRPSDSWAIDSGGHKPRARGIIGPLH